MEYLRIGDRALRVRLNAPIPYKETWQGVGLVGDGNPAIRRIGRAKPCAHTYSIRNQSERPLASAPSVAISIAQTTMRVGDSTRDPILKDAPNLKPQGGSAEISIRPRPTHFPLLCHPPYTQYAHNGIPIPPAKSRHRGPSLRDGPHPGWPNALFSRPTGAWGAKTAQCAPIRAYTGNTDRGIGKSHMAKLWRLRRLADRVGFNNAPRRGFPPETMRQNKWRARNTANARSAAHTTYTTPRGEGPSSAIRL